MQLSLFLSPAGTQQCFGLQSDSQQVAHPGALAAGLVDLLMKAWLQICYVNMPQKHGVVLLL